MPSEEGVFVGVSTVSPLSKIKISVGAESNDRREVRFTVQPAGLYVIRFKITSTQNSWRDALNPPSGSPTTEFEKATDANGQYTHIIEHNGTATYYVEVIALDYLSSAAVAFA